MIDFKVNKERLNNRSKKGCSNGMNYPKTAWILLINDLSESTENISEKVKDNVTKNFNPMCAQNQFNRKPVLLNQSNGLMRNNEDGECVVKNKTLSSAKLKLLIFRGLVLVFFFALAGAAWGQSSTAPTQTVCPGIEPYLVIPGNPNSTFIWSIATGVSGTEWTIIPGVDGYHISVNWANPVVPTTYILTLEERDASTTCIRIVSVSVTVNPLPVAMASSNSPVSAGTPLTLIGGPDGMTTYAWTGPDGFTSALQSPTITGVRVDATGIYTLTVTNSNGCSAQATTDVTVTLLPTATIAGTTTVCQNATAPVVTFTGAGGTAPYTFIYTINGGPNQIVVSTGDVATVTTPTAADGTFTYALVSVQDASGTTYSNPQTGTAVITVNPLPTPSIIGSNPVCQSVNSTTETYSTAITGNTFVWAVVGGTFIGQGTNQIVVIWSTPGTGSVSVTETGANGCSATNTINVTIQPAPVTSPIYHN